MIENLNMLATVSALGFAGGFAISFGAFCGLRLAAHLYGPLQTNSNYNVHVRDNRAD